MVDIKISLDNQSGKITAFTILGEDLKADELERAINSIRQTFGGASTSSQAPQAQATSVMAKDIRDLSSDRMTIKERLKLFLKFEYRGAWFNTIDVKDRYWRTYNEEIKISTVSTYLSRLHNEGFLERRGNKIEREYRIVEIPAEPQPAQDARVPEQQR
ncbi:hypothetical protein [Methanocella arvoryzae]|uniref:Uncharacterized protein n=1 Tax=Methanocella arvoryzae (strain DSM 22066 / NBRC 105507 / MRE50) TaxID=351160 RepID=Q0W1I4_METAR|nr:hypothetical protein [Methanocella arvoryzae]CAJ37759.1 hypothetical protein RCIX2718 [Methanocella arvoryzae MRE50]